MELIKLENLKKSYADGARNVEVLKGIDFTLKKGETVAVLGASGVGKSTLLNIMGALDRPSEGEFYFDGEKVFQRNEEELAHFRNKKIGFVFQFHHLLPEFSALENVMMPTLIGGGSYSEAEKAAKEFLNTVGLGERLTHKPGELSGGEQQRAAITRALIQEPELVLADEPTGNLDSKTGEDVFELLLKLNKQKGMTLVVVTHNEELAGRLDRRIKMVDGRLYDI